MARRSKRIGFLRPEQEIERLRSAREMLIDVHKAYPLKSEAFRRAQEAIDAIDSVAEVLVGDRQYFWLKDGPTRNGGDRT